MAKRPPTWPFRSPASREAVLAAYDAGLVPLSEGRRDFDVETSFGTTRVVSFGPETAPPLLLVHGASASAAVIRQEIEFYAEAGYRVHAPDIPGHGGRSEPRSISTVDDSLGRWLVEVLLAMELPPTSMVAYSLGALAALRAAQREPWRFERVVLGMPGGLSPPTVGKALPLLAYMARYRLGGDRRWLWKMAEAMCAPGNTPEPYVAGHCVLMLEHLFPDRTSLGRPSADDLRRIEVPFLVCPGEHDPLFDCARSMAAARALPHAVVEPIANCGHLFDTESLPRFRARSLRFLRGLDGS